ncbi:hypothetical protein [Leptolyngbya sp. PCC 6406]|uniref:hypothetical protein n=1 Tax=Leptolyngbya sp. PCC 6406 TaxID=1173264 RepID=UPI0002ABC493|nr:hypothetical protein [Leptolyngbya sp. PCC 6406]
MTHLSQQQPSRQPRMDLFQAVEKYLSLAYTIGDRERILLIALKLACISLGRNIGSTPACWFKDFIDEAEKVHKKRVLTLADPKPNRI